MASTPAPGTWADGPFHLCDVPKCDPKTHPAYKIAHVMVGIHNVFLRSINSIYRQAPHVRSPDDVKDLAAYTIHWTNAIHSHHDSEEELAFPAFERISKGEWKDIGERNKQEHLAFNRSLEKLVAYVRVVKEDPQSYEAAKLTGIIDDVMKVLNKHLLDEIETMEALDKYDAKEVSKAWAQLEADVQKKSSMYSLVPLMVGAHDSSYPGNDTTFPKFPFFMPYMIHYIFERPERSVWRFNPCDSWSNPRPLHFGPQVKL